MLIINKQEFKYDVQFSSDFKKSYKKIKKQGKDISKLLNIIEKLANGEKLEEKYKNHNLIRDKYYQDCQECHIEPDWLLIYKYNNDKLMLLLINTGSHSNLFNK